jgi:YesN/AraC family two-component response regulator
MNSIKKDHLEFICKQMNENLGIPFFLMDSNGEVLFEASTGYHQNPLSPEKEIYLQSLIKKDEPSDFPIIKSTNLLENFIIVNLESNDTFTGAIVGGPSLFTTPSDDRLKRMFYDSGLFIEQDLISIHYQSLPIIKHIELIRSGILIHYMVYHKILDTENVIVQNKQLEIESVPIENPNLNISMNRQQFNSHHDFLASEKILGGIKAGNKREVLNDLQKIYEEYEFGTLSKKSQLRNDKNLTISIIALATRAAILGGVHHEIAYTLSDLYIQRLEELDNGAEIFKLCQKALGDFADRVYASQNEKYSKPISLCRSYIVNNIYEKISLADLTELVDFTPNYLSKLFKKETGLSISEFIHKIKVEEAIKLMSFSSYSLSDICSLLNFTDQSYFAKIFKKYTGVTPKKFLKNENVL